MRRNRRDALYKASAFRSNRFADSTSIPPFTMLAFSIVMLMASLVGATPIGIGQAGVHVGDATFYDVGMGACGVYNVPTDFIAAVSHELYDTFPGYSGGNPNNK